MFRPLLTCPVLPWQLLRALAVLLALAPRGLPGQELHGLFIGINDYVEYEGVDGGDLQGAEGDALLMRQTMQERWGLDPANTKTLLSREATKSEIQDAISGWLAGRVEPGDLAIVYFAGHGAQAFDLDGDEPDGLDETLAPADVLPLSSANDIRDDEFRLWLATLSADVVVILDSCHSGTATRGGEMRARALDRPLPSEGGREPERVRQRPDAESMTDPSGQPTIVELAAAAPNQSAMEGPFGATDGAVEQRGAFTWMLVQELLTAEEGASYADVIEGVARRLQDRDLLQDPHVTGPAGAALFSPLGVG